LPPGRTDRAGEPGAQSTPAEAQPGPYGPPGALAGGGPQQHPEQPQTQELPLSLPLPVYQQPGGQQGHDGRNAVPFDPAAAHPTPVEQQVQQPQQLQEPQQPQQLQPEYQQVPGQAAQPEQLPQQPQPQQAQPQLQQHQLTVPVGPGGRVRPLGGEGLGSQQGVYVPEQREPERYAYEEQPGQPMNQLPDDVPREEVYYATFRQFLADHSRYPSAYQFGQRLRETYGVNDLSNSELAAYVDDFKERVRLEREAIP
ncbi:hypothetical protein GTZ78_52375, partial [Streptomyces sp. SID8361]|nr:hypothetical protein [Streptomyces sp. SID8361]